VPEAPASREGPRARRCLHLALAAVFLWSAVRPDEGRAGEREPALPKPLAKVKHPPDNASTPEKLALGRQLFFDPRLSRTGKVSCATCHDPEKGFSNGQRFAVGVDGKRGKRKVPGLTNVGHSSTLFWDGRAATLEEQALAPISSAVEMDMRPAALAEKLNAVAAYSARFAKAFGGKATPKRIAMALAAFQRSLVSDDTPFDRYLRGDRRALSKRARRGMALFFGDARCAVCHKGPNLSDGQFHNIGAAEKGDLGRRAVTKKAKDHGAFRTPQLREAGRTAPYMHNGKFKTLTEVVQHYNFGGVTDEENEHRDGELKVLYLSEDQVEDLVAFLAEGLTSPRKKKDRKKEDKPASVSRD
jgi:cytochrome c peroxidase